MPKIPRDLTQDQAVRAFVRAGGVVLQGRGRGSHCNIRMPNDEVLTIPYHVRVGLLGATIKQAGLTIEEFLDLL